jgi:hypothetical protein
MRSARSLYRLQLSLGLLGAGAALLSLMVALRPVELAPPSPGTMLEACRGLALPGGTTLLVLAPAAIGLVALLRGARALARGLRDARRFLSSLDVRGRRSYGGCEVVVFEGNRAQAFCAGLLRPRIYLSSAACELPATQLAAVVAHEHHHRRRADPLRLLLAEALAEALFFVPVAPRLADRYAALSELAADEAAARQHGRRRLAAALLAFGEGRGRTGVAGIAPERVDQLLGEQPRWELPVAPLLRSLAAIAAVIGLALAAGALTSGLELSLPLLLGEGCMVLMLALPLLLAGGALVALRSRRVGTARA